MVKKFSTEFKQQSVDYALSNAHLSITELANHLGIGKSTLDKWIRLLAPNKTSRRELTIEQQKIIALEKEVKELKIANEILKKAHVYFINHPSR
ncbi:transposase [Orbus sturtevantii]|uniref:transposase n=1 Tax=Orbus sturtevantii TaxID=3074109 RepID=UPI00370DC586